MQIKRIEINNSPKTRNGYSMPHRHDKIQIFQGYNGQYSHFAMDKGGFILDLRFAVDFEVPVGTPVIAAKPGTVAKVLDFSEEFYIGTEINKGLKHWHNFIILEHEDRSFTLYSHLEKDSSAVRVGDFVGQEQFLARTGRSGWTGIFEEKPHLHFEAYSLTKKPGRQSFPVMFENYKGSLEDSVVRASR